MAQLIADLNKTGVQRNGEDEFLIVASFNASEIFNQSITPREFVELIRRKALDVRAAKVDLAIVQSDDGDVAAARATLKAAVNVDRRLTLLFNVLQEML